MEIDAALVLVPLAENQVSKDLQLKLLEEQ